MSHFFDCLVASRLPGLGLPPRSAKLAVAATVALAAIAFPKSASAQVAEMVVRAPVDVDDEPKRVPSTKEEPVGATMLQIAGLRAIQTQTQSTLGDRDGTSVLFAIDQEISTYLPKSGFAGRSSSHGHIGGGSAGFDGMYVGQLTGGPRFGSSAHALAIRAGLGGLLRGNDRFYQSELTLPVGEIAYQAHIPKQLFFEVGVSAGYVLVGRHNVEGYRQRLGNSGKLGAFALVQSKHIQLVGSYSRLFASSSPDEPIDTAQVNVCLSPFWALLLCGNFSQAESRFLPASDAGPASTTTRFMGLSVGLGGLSVD